MGNGEVLDINVVVYGRAGHKKPKFLPVLLPAVKNTDHHAGRLPVEKRNDTHAQHGNAGENTVPGKLRQLFAIRDLHLANIQNVV